MPTFDPATRPGNSIENSIRDVLEMELNTLAGRPNAGNYLLDFAQKGPALPEQIAKDYLQLSLELFIKNVNFNVEVLPHLSTRSFPAVLVAYEVL